MIALDPRWDLNKRRSETEVLAELIDLADLDAENRGEIVHQAAELVTSIRSASRPSIMDVFLAEYGLSTDEGVALMCLAEALLRVPDAQTIDALIEDKIAPSDWSTHIGKSSSPMVNASTWGLLLTGKVLDDPDPGIAGRLRSMIKRVGEPVIRKAVAGAMREMGRQFVLGQDIDAAMKRASKTEANGFTYSYDMLGEAAMTAADARAYANAYDRAIEAIASRCSHTEIASNPGISIKLSALHPRYEVAKTARVMSELVPVLKQLTHKAAAAGMGLNIDAEEMDRLGLSMAVIEEVLSDPTLAGWDGFGVVVQAYGRRAGDILDGLYEMAKRYDRRIMVRLVKGAYWDTEIKHAQVEGLSDFPVFTQKTATDISYIANARRLLGMTDRIYPQFATHNAHTVATILHLAETIDPSKYEFQRLHGMGEALHSIVHHSERTRCRIYAPVGAHRDLLAYLVRRLLENGANSSFVNKVVDEDVPPAEVVACPFDTLASGPSGIAKGPDLYAPERVNSLGFDLFDVTKLRAIEKARILPKDLIVGPILAGPVTGGAFEPSVNPTTGEEIASIMLASVADVETALSCAKSWQASNQERAVILKKAADLYEADYGTVFALLAAEAGKTLMDAVAELREAVDFIRFYADETTKLEQPPRGIYTCISPWNFPLAIFSGQIAAALAAGNAVLAKPAETTPAIAAWGVQKLLEAGVPREALQLLPGEGHDVGKALTSDVRVKGVAFTGSTATARHIQRAIAEYCTPGTPLIAETGGLNAMIVDSTALPEQAIRDIVASAFQSAGQRCSALRCLYVQKDVAPSFLKMLIGAMNELEMGDPWDIATDVGPLITAKAATDIDAYIAKASKDRRVKHQLVRPRTGNFVAPTLIEVTGIGDLGTEVFGPILHFATFESDQLDQVIEDINATGYGLTFGLHTRIDDRVQKISDAVHAGNIYANRNQIGAVVGSQPFGGEGLSGTGPKAGGPFYLKRFVAGHRAQGQGDALGVADDEELANRIVSASAKQAESTSTTLPGPTGELNRLSTTPRKPILCLGPNANAIREQVAAVQQLGGVAVGVDQKLAPKAIADLPDFGGLIWWGDTEHGRDYAMALADREGAIIPLICGFPDQAHVLMERHLCVDTTAAGGNASLLAAQS